jgi:hypothetical protein
MVYMPIEYLVRDDGMFVHAIATEPLLTEHVLEFLDRVSQDSRVKPGYIMLFDESRILESHIDTKGLEVIVARQESVQVKRPSKLAIVAGPGSAFPRALEYEKMVSPEKEKVIVFHNEHVARRWLGVPPGDQ